MCREALSPLRVFHLYKLDLWTRSSLPHAKSKHGGVTSCLPWISEKHVIQFKIEFATAQIFRRLCNGKMALYRHVIVLRIEDMYDDRIEGPTGLYIGDVRINQLYQHGNPIGVIQDLEVTMLARRCYIGGNQPIRGYWRRRLQHMLLSSTLQHYQHSPEDLLRISDVRLSNHS